VPAAPACQARQSVFKYAAFEVGLELSHHEPRQAAGFIGPLLERGPELLDDPIENALVRAMAGVAIGSRRVGRPGVRESECGHASERGPAGARGLLATP